MYQFNNLTSNVPNDDMLIHILCIGGGGTGPNLTGGFSTGGRGGDEMVIITYC